MEMVEFWTEGILASYQTITNSDRTDKRMLCNWSLWESRREHHIVHFVCFLFSEAVSSIILLRDMRRRFVRLHRWITRVVRDVIWGCLCQCCSDDVNCTAGVRYYVAPSLLLMLWVRRWEEFTRCLRFSSLLFWVWHFLCVTSFCSCPTQFNPPEASGGGTVQYPH